MLKNIFCKIMSDEHQRQKMNSLSDKNNIYKIFCENGYTKSYDEFEKEMETFLNSEDGKKLISHNFDELSDDMLEMIAGGVNAKQAVTAGIATLLTAFTIGTIGNQILSQSNTDTAPSDSQSISSFSNDNNEQSNDNNAEQAKDDNSDANKPGGPQTMNNRRGPNRPGGPGGIHNAGGPSGIHNAGGPGGGFGGPAGDHRRDPNGPGGGFVNNHPGDGRPADAVDVKTRTINLLNKLTNFCSLARNIGANDNGFLEFLNTLKNHIEQGNISIEALNDMWHNFGNRLNDAYDVLVNAIHNADRNAAANALLDLNEIMRNIHIEIVEVIEDNEDNAPPPIGQSQVFNVNNENNETDAALQADSFSIFNDESQLQKQSNQNQQSEKIMLQSNNQNYNLQNENHDYYKPQQNTENQNTQQQNLQNLNVQDLKQKMLEQNQNKANYMEAKQKQEKQKKEKQKYQANFKDIKAKQKEQDMKEIIEANQKNFKALEEHKKTTAQIKQFEQKQNEVKKLLKEMNIQFKGEEQQQLKSQANAFLKQDLDKLSQTQQGIYLLNANNLINQMKNALGNKIQ